MSDNGTTVLAVDIGSSRTHIAAVDVNELTCADGVDFCNMEFDASFMPSIKNILLRRGGVRRINVSSCVKGLASRAKTLCEAEGLFDRVDSVRVHGGLPVSFDYDDPRSLGADRVCNALACAAMFEGRDCVIIDSGTAVTIDRLRGGRIFEGGAILPGLSMQLGALRSGTDALPAVDLSACEKISFPATSTRECIGAGVLHGAAGAIEKIIGGCVNAKVIATGGGWKLTAPYVDHHEITAVPGLTLIGAALYRSTA